MQIGITGHTQGIGKSLLTVFRSHGCNVIGFSKSTGFDIEKDSDRKVILNQVRNVDVFINNAYHEHGQLLMLRDVLNLWEGTNKIVVNISSQVIYNSSPLHTNEQVAYRIAKTELNEFVNQYCGTVRILNVIPDLTLTNLKVVPEGFDRDRFVHPDDLANVVFDVLSYSDRLFINELKINGNSKNKF